MSEGTFPVGQLVVCIKTDDPDYNFLIGHFGEVVSIDNRLSEWMSGGADYTVHFPALKTVPCKKCKKAHEGNYPMMHRELKKLDDPDNGEFEWYSEEKPIPLFGFEVIK